MKKIKLLLLFLSLSLLLSGCGNFRLATSIDDLIAPVSPSGDDASVQTALDSYCKSGYLIKIPTGGKYTTSFIFFDLDNDGKDEAVAFYEPTDDRGTVSIAVIENKDSEWSVVSSVKGEGSDVRSVDFCDVNDDGLNEIIVNWSVISAANNYVFRVYGYSGDNKSPRINGVGKSISAGEFICVDINDDGVKEVVVFRLGSADESPCAQLYSFKNNDQKMLGETKLDSSIVSFEHITSGITDEGLSVYADALRSDGDSMVTEFIYWSDYYDSIVSPFYSYATGVTADTTRNCHVNSMDIDNDDVIEIPTDENYDGLPQQVSAQDWVIYENTVLMHKCYTFYCARDSYFLLLKDDDFNDVSVKYSSDDRKLTVISDKTKKECFSVITVIKTAYEANKSAYSGYTEIADASGFVYLAAVNKDSDIKFTTDELKTMIKPC